MRYLSICSGIEAATVAWHPLGWQPVAFSEIEPFPSAVLAHRWPDTPNLGDMTKFNDWKHTSPIDLLVGGTPCQAFSVAGLRQGLRDPRGNLTLTFLAMVEKFHPGWVVWENVPGVLSDRTNAFGQFLAGLGELGYQYAYRVLDAQHFGVPQRRRRVFVVASAADRPHPFKILFEPESLCRDLTPRRKAGEKITDGVANCLGGSGQSGGFRTTDLDNQGAFIPETTGPITCSDYGTEGIEGIESGRIIAMAHGQANAEILSDGSGPTLTCLHEAPIMVYCQKTADPLTANEAKTYTHEGATFRTRNVQAYPNCVRRLTPIECERLQGFPDNYTRIPWGNGNHGTSFYACQCGYTFDEDLGAYGCANCEGEEGPADLVSCPDGPRYKALGNSMAVPVMRWIGRRIDSLTNPNKP